MQILKMLAIYIRVTKNLLVRHKAFWISLLSGLLSFRFNHDSDLWWHLRVGEYIFNNWSVPRNEFITFHTNAEYIYHSWLSELVIYISFKFFGLWGVSLVYLIVFSLSFYFTIKITHLISKSAVPIYLLAFSPFISAIIEYRIQLISYLLLNVLYYIVLRYQNSNKLSYALAILFATWANFHGGFILGIVLLSVILIQKKNTTLFNKIKYVAIAILSTLINPYGNDLWTLVGDMGSNVQATYANYDWSSILAGPSKWYFMFLIICYVLIYFSHHKKNWPVLISSCIFFIASIYSKRYIMPALVLLLPELLILLSNSTRTTFIHRLRAKNSGLLFPIKIGITTFAVTVFILPLRSLAYATQTYHSLSLYSQAVNVVPPHMTPYPHAALHYLSSLPANTRILNLYEWGGYLSWFAPQQQIFIDGRGDNLTISSKPLLTDYQAAVFLQPQWSEVIDKYHIRAVLLPPEFPLTQQLLNEPEWQVIYVDTFSVLLHKSL